MTRIQRCFAMMIAFIISGCTVFPYGAYTNNRSADTTQAAATSQVSFVLRNHREAKNCAGRKVSNPKQNKDVLVLLALSGGGSRAAYFSALSMLEMQKMKIKIGDAASDLLHEVDAISSVSGGSLAGAYYTMSHDPESECAGFSNRLWNVDDDSEIRERMTLDYRDRWIGNWFWPSNIAAFWLSNYDRTDIMAQTLADNLFDNKRTGIDLSLGELNALRPNLILNATTGSRVDGTDIPFGQVFTFTTDDFTRICSSIEDYSIARAVMASASFPGVFNFMTLRNYCPKPGARDAEDVRYLHVFDGGNGDNLGLTSLKRVIWKSLIDHDKEPSLPYKKVIVILIDAFISSHGADPYEPDPRGIFDYIIDTNFTDATDSLLESNRERLLAEFEGHYLFPFGTSFYGETNKECAKFFHGEDVKHYCSKRPDYWDNLNEKIDEKLTFVHLSFDKVGGCTNSEGASFDCLRPQLLGIPTDFRLRAKLHEVSGLTDADAIACAVPTLFNRVDRRFCRDLLPAPSPLLGRKWDLVKQILEGPAADESPGAALPARGLQK